MPEKVVIIDAEEFRAIGILLAKIEVELDNVNCIPNDMAMKNVKEYVNTLNQILSEED